MYNPYDYSILVFISVNKKNLFSKSLIVEPNKRRYVLYDENTKPLQYTSENGSCELNVSFFKETLKDINNYIIDSKGYLIGIETPIQQNLNPLNMTKLENIVDENIEINEELSDLDILNMDVCKKYIINNLNTFFSIEKENWVNFSIEKEITGIKHDRDRCDYWNFVIEYTYLLSRKSLQGFLHIKSKKNNFTKLVSDFKNQNLINQVSYEIYSDKFEPIDSKKFSKKEKILPKIDYFDVLEKLKDSFIKGILSEKEFSDKKYEILNRISKFFIKNPHVLGHGDFYLLK